MAQLALRLGVVHLRLLDEALDGQLYPALQRVIRGGHEPTLTGVRERLEAEPSRWAIQVDGGGETAFLGIDRGNIVATGIAAQLWIADIIEELKEDLRASLKGCVPEDAFDEYEPPWGGRGSGARFS